jgi:hypothetical protein
MQSNKTSSRKPRETAANATGPLSEGTATGPVKKPRATAAAASGSKPSKAAAPATRHRKETNDSVTLPNNEVSFTEAAGAKTALKAMAAASGAGAEAFRSDIVQSVGQSTEPRTVSRDEIAALAHSYWLERGGRHGAHEDDWLRAEQELKAIG